MAGSSPEHVAGKRRDFKRTSLCCLTCSHGRRCRNRFADHRTMFRCRDRQRTLAQGAPRLARDRSLQSLQRQHRCFTGERRRAGMLHQCRRVDEVLRLRRQGTLVANLGSLWETSFPPARAYSSRRKSHRGSRQAIRSRSQSHYQGGGQTTRPGPCLLDLVACLRYENRRARVDRRIRHRHSRYAASQQRDL